MVYIRRNKADRVEISNGYKRDNVLAYQVAIVRPNTGDAVILDMDAVKEDSLYTTIAIDLTDQPLDKGEYVLEIRDKNDGEVLATSVAQIGVYDDLYDEADNIVNIIE